MADQPVYLPLPVTGALNTADPIGNRPLGTLVVAKDLSPRTWGPRVGSKAFTRVWEGPGTASLYDNITLNGTNNARAIGSSFEDQFRDLGTKFTLDLYFRLEDWAYATGEDDVGIYRFTANGLPYINVGLYGDTQGGNEKLMKVSIATSSSRSAASAAVVITGSVVISTGTTQAFNHHVRIVRDGATATLYVDGLQDGQTTGLAATEGLNSVLGSIANVNLGTIGTGKSFKGRIFGAVLRDGAFSSQPIEAIMPCSPWATNVHHYILGRNIDLGGGQDHFFDAGRFAVHSRVRFTAGSDYTVAASNDDASPAPIPVQGLTTWTTRTNRTATSVVAGGVMSTSIVS